MSTKYVLAANPKDLRSTAKVGDEVPRVLFDAYYRALLQYFSAIGKFWHLYKLHVNAGNGVYPAQVIAREYNHEGSKYEIEIAERENERWKWIRKVSDLQWRAGLLPFDEEGMKKVMAFLDDADRRRYVRDAARRAEKKGQLVSICDLMRKRYVLENSKKKKEHLT